MVVYPQSVVISKFVSGCYSGASSCNLSLIKCAFISCIFKDLVRLPRSQKYVWLVWFQVVEYVGEIVGLRVADKREAEYHSGKRLQYQGACYLFRIDADQIIDATRKGGIARFVNHSCSVIIFLLYDTASDNLVKVKLFAE